MNSNGELTLRAVVLGVILSLAMAAANMYQYSLQRDCADPLPHTHAHSFGSGGQPGSGHRICR
jgi:hypothetical protein